MIENAGYRADIDGLRAVAVVSVVGFHAFPATVPGGYVGVDVFFVISGYLITGILLREISHDRFSLVGFYERRIRRIFPALLLLLAGVMAAGWLLLLGDEDRAIGKHVLAGASFVSNFVLWSETGYFDPAAETKPLLHLWSLAIEEQFYLLWPILLWLASRWRRGAMVAVAAVGGVSFVLNVALIGNHPSAIFYWPLTRFWELLAGAALAVVATQAAEGELDVRAPRVGARGGRWFSNHMVSLVGFGLIIGSVAAFEHDMPFPGWPAVLPVAGTVLVLLGGPGSWLSRRVLAQPALVFIGLISYPLYLWHWPLLSFARIQTFEEPTTTLKVALLGISVILAWVSHSLIERPARWGRIARAKPRLVAAWLCGGMMVIGVGGWMKYDGLFPTSALQRDSERFQLGLTPDRLDLTPEYKRLWMEDCNFVSLEAAGADLDPSCITPQSGESVFIWGDSHGQDIRPGLASLLEPLDVSVLQIASSGCSPAVQLRDPVTPCDRANVAALSSIVSLRPDLVIVTERAHENTQHLDAVVDTIVDHGIPVVLIGPKPLWNADLYRILYRRFGRAGEAIPERLAVGLADLPFKTDSVLKVRFGAARGVKYVSLIDSLCNDRGCRVRVGPSIPDDIISIDAGHLSQNGSEFVANRILGPVLFPILEQTARISGEGQRTRL